MAHCQRYDVILVTYPTQTPVLLSGSRLDCQWSSHRSTGLLRPHPLPYENNIYIYMYMYMYIYICIYIYIYIVLYSPVCVQRTGRKTDVVRPRPDCASCPQNGTRDTAGRRVKCLDLIISLTVNQFLADHVQLHKVSNFLAINEGLHERTEYIDIFLFSAHHSIEFCFRCSVYWWKGECQILVF